MAITPMDRELARLLSEGQAAAKRGDKAMARALLTQLVEKEPRHEEAWMWLSGVVADPFEQQICLENALVINPANAQARKGLEYIAARTGAASSALATPAPGASEGQPPATEAHGVASPFGDSAPFGQPALPSEGVPPWAVGDPEFQPDLPQSEQTALPPADAAAPTPPYAAPMVSTQPNGAHASEQIDAADMGLPADAQPFVVPDGNTGAHSDDGIPDWLGNLTPTVQINEEPQYNQTYAPFNPAEFAVPAPAAAPPTTMVGDMQDVLGAADVHPGADVAEAHTNPPMSGHQAPQGPFFDAGAPDMGPMGPYTELQMPAPDQLPGTGPTYAQATEQHAGAQPSEQPWYLQRTTGNMPPMPESDEMPASRQGTMVADDSGVRRPPAMVECPNCRESVPDTSLACPNCRYSFFVNCPFCHELVDTSDARPGVSEPCPYCKNTITRMDMGLGTINEYASQKVPGSRPGVQHVDPKLAFPSMNQQVIEGPMVERRPALAWVVDLMWLAAIIVMVWALTQLPTWLNLSGQY
ncbi:MAG TPA: hypothetical protein VFR15_09485 [Chloroflexia bacterium]|nr:hypothetical protein [Chloroflexia bacterium]